MRGATNQAHEHCAQNHISIHAPRAGSDERVSMKMNKTIDISIHAPRAGSDNNVSIHLHHFHTKISIHAPRAGSDPSSKFTLFTIKYFNPRSPCGERLKSSLSFTHFLIFQSTLPVRGATANTSIFLYEFPACLLSSPYKSDMSHFPRCFS